MRGINICGSAGVKDGAGSPMTGPAAVVYTGGGGGMTVLRYRAAPGCVAVPGGRIGMVVARGGVWYTAGGIGIGDGDREGDLPRIFCAAAREVLSIKPPLLGGRLGCRGDSGSGKARRRAGSSELPSDILDRRLPPCSDPTSGAPKRPDVPRQASTVVFPWLLSLR